MKTVVLGILFGVFLVALAHAEDVPACCGAHTDRTGGWSYNIPPMDSVWFGEQSLGQSRLGGESTSHMSKESSSRIPGESYSPTHFGLSNLEEGGYNPGTGSQTITPTKPWHQVDKEWASRNLKKYWNVP